MKRNSVANRLLEEILKQNLCVGCGACLVHCPYFKKYKGVIQVLDECDLSEGECYKYCPRTHMDLDAISHKIFGVPYCRDELGIVIDVFMARSADSVIHTKAQDGGTITTLLGVALEEGLIDAAILTKLSADKAPAGFVAKSKEEILQCAGNSYESSFVLEAFNQISEESNHKLGLVGLPCQVQALGKMKADPPKNKVNIGNVKLVLGLFCGWAFSTEKFHQFLKEAVDLSQVVKFDIPHHPADTFDIYTVSGVKSFKIDDMRKFINPSCSYCLDMTSEFADISVGSGRRLFGWNTVVVRSKTGADLIDLAKRKGILVTQPLSEDNLSHLKKASVNKKKRALTSMASTRNKENMPYLDLADGIAKRILS